MPILAALAFAVAAQDASVLRTVRLADQDFHVVAPAPGSGPKLPYVAWNGWNYLFQDGKLVGRQIGSGGWEEAATLFQQTQIKPDAAIWHTKVVLFTRSSIIERGNIVRQRRAILTKDSVKQALQAVAELTVMADAYGAGNLRMQVDAEIEPEMIVQDAENAFDEHFIRSYFGPRINDGGFEADDKGYRGPYDTVLFIHPGLIDSHGTVMVGRTAVHDVPLFHHAHVNEPGGLRRSLYEAWLNDLGRAAANSGLQVKRIRTPFEIASVWPSILNWRRGEDYLKNLANRGEPVETPWTTIASSPLTLLPRLDRPGSNIKLVPLDCADFYSTHAKQPFATGLVVSSTGIDIAFSPSDLLLPPLVNPKESKSPALSKQDFSGDFTPGDVSPNVKLAIDQEPDRGGVLVYREIGDARFGAAAFGRIEGDPKLMSFKVKSDSTEPLAIIAFDESGKTITTYTLGRVDKIEQDSTTLDFMADGKWHNETILLPPGTAQLVLAPPRAATHYEREQIQPIEYRFDDFDTGASGPATVVVEPPGNAELIRARAARIASVEDLGRFLVDSSRIVVLNALARAAEIPDKRFGATIFRAANDSDPVISRFALDALDKAADGPTMTMIRHIMETSPSEANKANAATVLARSGDGALAGPISLLFAARSWQARLAAAQAIAKLKGEDVEPILMVFLQEVDPQIRMAVIEAANPKLDLSKRRLRWSAQNDPSDAIRAASWIKVGEPEAGLEDSSFMVHVAMLMHLIGSPLDKAAPALKAELRKSSYELRSLALNALAAAPGSLTLEDLAPVLADRYPKVQSALLAIVEKKGLKLPPATIELLKQSLDPGVAEKARSMG